VNTRKGLTNVNHDICRKTNDLREWRALLKHGFDNTNDNVKVQRRVSLRL